MAWRPPGPGAGNAVEYSRFAVEETPGFRAAFDRLAAIPRVTLTLRLDRLRRVHPVLRDDRDR